MSLLKVRFSDPPKANELLRMQDNIGSAYDRPTAAPILGAVVVEGVELDTTAVNVEHGLGRDWTGWIVTDKDADATVYRSGSDNPELYLTLTASAAVTVDLMVW